jgi:DNA helicase-2/ATP-dependent DNA helicase PcrA
MNFTDDLNAPQASAVTHTDGPLVIFAGAGSGKTRTLTRRIAYLMTEQGVPAWRILAVTFTNKAAREMRERIETLVGPIAQRLWMGTFHSMCARMLRMHGDRIGIDPHFVIFDSDDSTRLIKEIVGAAGLDSQRFKPAGFLHQISDAKNKLQSPAAMIDAAESPLEKHAAQFYKQYQERLRASHALDFDDLLGESVRLLETSRETLEYWSDRFQHVLIDEFQDANLAQFRWAQLLASKHRNICVVGDDDQSIYAWRGADVQQILNFTKHYPDAKIIRLEQNYRSTATILDAAHGVISRNAGRSAKKLWTEGAQGESVVLHGAATAHEEAFWVVDQINQLRRIDRVPYSHIAILCRVNAQSRIFEEIFLRSRIPLRLIGTQRFYDRREIKDLTSYLRVLYNPHDNVALSRIINVPARGIGATTLERLTETAAQSGRSLWEVLSALEVEKYFSPAVHKKLLPLLHLLQELQKASLQTERVDDLLQLITKKTSYINYLLNEKDGKGEDRVRNVDELTLAASEFEPPQIVAEDGEILPPPDALDYLGQFLETVTLDDERQQAVDTGEAVTLMTLHGAKGLEFPVVFLVGMEQGLLPHARAVWNTDATNNDLEEERRLCYVGITRAMQRLYLSYAAQRTLHGRTEITKPSQFLEEIPTELLNRSGMARFLDSPRQALVRDTLEQFSTMKTTHKPADADLPTTYELGDRLRHPKFGEGLIVKMSPHGGNSEWVEIAFLQPGIGTKKLAVHYAPLEKVLS